ncbi:hypothetical protein Pcinc_017244 [Petrolisthes cinctipes]|uniref:Uncharacterized protein n=1 Tax=Petrolisthes cinctipes TaxID=88211 RepID=A0AAE1FRV0_PETCI|nr:hypothetical protein Pcinc_017244 [Petrolisthes cinctipes]
MGFDKGRVKSWSEVQSCLRGGCRIEASHAWGSRVGVVRVSRHAVTVNWAERKRRRAGETKGEKVGEGDNEVERLAEGALGAWLGGAGRGVVMRMVKYVSCGGDVGAHHTVARPKSAFLNLLCSASLKWHPHFSRGGQTDKEVQPAGQTGSLI